MNRNIEYSGIALFERIEQVESFGRRGDVVDSDHFRDIRAKLKQLGMQAGDLCFYRQNRYALSVEVELGQGNLLLRGARTTGGARAGLKDVADLVLERLASVLPDLPRASDLLLSTVRSPSPLRFGFVLDLVNEPESAARLHPLHMRRRLTVTESAGTSLAGGLEANPDAPRGSAEANLFHLLPSGGVNGKNFLDVTGGPPEPGATRMNFSSYSPGDDIVGLAHSVRGTALAGSSEAASPHLSGARSTSSPS